MLVLLLLGVLLAFWLQEAVYRKYWNKNLRLRVRFADAHVYEGDTSHLTEEISNDKKLPLPALEVRLNVSRNLEFSGEARANSSITDQSYNRDIFSFLFHQKVVHTLPFVCRRRGLYQIRRAELVGCSLFFRPEFYWDTDQSTQLYVYPAQADTRRIRLVCRAISGMVLVQNRIYPDPFEFSGIREYRPQDPMHHINWKASARSASLMVNQFDSTTSIQTTLILDVEDSHILRYESLTEEAIRIVSSLAARMAREKMELQLISNAFFEILENGQAESGTVSWSCKAGGGRVQELNRLLAAIDTQRPCERIDAVLKKEAAKKRSGHIYVLISKNQDADTAAALQMLAAGGNEILWVVPVRPRAELLVREAASIRLMRWEVEG